ncbi:MAG TPA: GntR family transcriptional regulator [Mycobacteriales bacterium]|nr:GntR family transcriptional regulator [Mycobacteriales bacterium]
MRPDEIANALRRAVRERVFAPGEVLNQDQLARRFGVSRVPLREALRTLVGEGLVVMNTGLGAVVTELEPDEVNELYELRLQLEPALAVPIVTRARPVDVQQLASMVTSMDELEAGQSEEWSTLNYRFHRRLYELSERRHAIRLVVQVLNLVEPYARVHAHVLGSRTQAQAQRTEMVAALRGRDGKTLRALLVDSIATARAELVASMQQVVAPPTDPLRRLVD